MPEHSMTRRTLKTYFKTFHKHVGRHKPYAGETYALPDDSSFAGGFDGSPDFKQLVSKTVLNMPNAINHMPEKYMLFRRIHAFAGGFNDSPDVKNPVSKPFLNGLDIINHMPEKYMLCRTMSAFAGGFNDSQDFRKLVSKLS